jgi:hypothetical protein
MANPPYASAISLLEDTSGACTLSYQAGVGDTGVLSTFATSVIVNVDKISIKRTMTTADHSGGQNPEEINRATKFTGSADVELKLYVDANPTIFKVGLQVQLAVVATIGADSLTVTLQGIITDADPEFSGPSTFKITIKPYAVTGAAFITLAYAT